MKKRVLSAMMIVALCLGLAPGAASADVLTEDLPEVGAASYVIMDGDTQQVLFGNDYDTAFDPGSLVQIMTAVLIIEEGNLNDSVTVPEIPEDANTGNRLYLRKGERINLSDLLEGIIIYNANDAAIAAATHMAGSEEAFVEEMNAKAEELGMTDTTFASVYGSAEDQTTTAQDLAILAEHASSLPKYVELAIQPTLEWDSEMNQDTLTNVNGMQNVEAQAIGIKLNDSEPINLAASISMGDRTIVGVMLACTSEDSAYLDMQEALNLGLENTEVVDLITADAVVTTLHFGEDKSIRVAATADYAITTSQSDSSNYRSTLVINQTELPINADDEVGVIRIYEGDEVIDEVPLVALDSASAGVNWAWVLVVVLVLLYIGTYVFLYRAIRERQQGRGATKLSSGKRAPAARVSRPQTKTTPAPAKPAAAPQQKRPQTGGSKTLPKNPSAGSSAGRQGLEQRLRERHTSHPHNNGGRR